jgi:hypothetical protein
VTTFLDLMNSAQRGRVRVAISPASLAALESGNFGEGTPGPTGPEGPEGPQGEQGIPGEQGLFWMGTYTGATMYQVDDAVQHNGSAYRANVLTQGNAPPHADWDLIVSKGDTGNTGPQGIQGDPGIQGEQGETGAQGTAGTPGGPGTPGPNSISGSTTTTLTGLLKGNGANISAATAPTDYVATGDSRLSDARTPLTHSHAISDVTSLQTSLDAKAPSLSPTFTGVVTGITKSMVGLGLVDNTADTAKPVSTAQQTALDLKANLASPTLTGTPAAPTPAVGTNTTQIATTAYVRAAPIDTLGAPTDVTTLDASTSAHGLMKKYPGGTTTFLRADGSFAAPTAAAADPSYSPGSFTVVTETGRLILNHLKLASAERATLEGTGRLVVSG